MAEETQKESGRSKRRLRTGTETVRERTEKLQQKAAEPKNPNIIRAFFGGFFWPLRKLSQLIGKLGRFRVFRWIGYVLCPPYIRNSWRELRQVSWPGFKLTMRLTYAVILFSVSFGLIVAGVDFVLDKIFKEIIVK
ncbi:MAG: preprotein translocase subunit SecE [Candidatus Saccharibacteria bacterium]|nr:preprotein translocase subunit SecE [Candidatus Saccharibacteria bacterium]MDB5181782.1 preprotein translocase subunit SecE [Candidatus Saccharibacteria bacterium]